MMSKFVRSSAGTSRLSGGSAPPYSSERQAILLIVDQIPTTARMEKHLAKSKNVVPLVESILQSGLVRRWVRSMGAAERTLFPLTDEEGLEQAQTMVQPGGHWDETVQKAAAQEKASQKFKNRSHEERMKALRAGIQAGLYLGLERATYDDDDDDGQAEKKPAAESDRDSDSDTAPGGVAEEPGVPVFGLAVPEIHRPALDGLGLLADLGPPPSALEMRKGVRLSATAAQPVSMTSLAFTPLEWHCLSYERVHRLKLVVMEKLVTVFGTVRTWESETAEWALGPDGAEAGWMELRKRVEAMAPEEAELDRTVSSADWPVLVDRIRACERRLTQGWEHISAILLGRLLDTGGEEERSELASFYARFRALGQKDRAMGEYIVKDVDFVDDCFRRMNRYLALWSRKVKPSIMLDKEKAEEMEKKQQQQAKEKEKKEKDKGGKEKKDRDGKGR